MRLPEFIEIETSRYCNRRCPWCPNGLSAERSKQELMPWPLFASIVAQLENLVFAGWIALHNYNEPLANPRIIDELRLIVKRLPYSKPSIFTNGDLLTPLQMRNLADVGVRYLRVTRYPKNAEYADAPNPSVIKRWLQRTKLDGVPGWKFIPVRQGFAATCMLREMTIEVISPDIGTYNFRGGTTKIPLSRDRDSPCDFTSRSAAIDYRGQLKMCCNVFPEEALHSDFIIGSLIEHSFSNLWQSEKMTEYRRAHLRSDWSLSPICSQCTHFLKPREGPEQTEVGSE